ncbi:MAG: hypothetical protein AAF547_08120 [Actinomycetota bacterium]
MDHVRLGTVVKCQISARGLIQEKRYVAADIVDADELHLGPDGVVGWCAGRAVLNHHHRLNPRMTTWKPHRLLSVGFTGHYAAMAERFGEARLGSAAENVIVDCDRIVPLDEVAPGLQVRCADGAVIDLTGATVAKPCVPFTKFLLGDQDAPDETVAPNRAFLGDGMRGYVMGLADQTEPAVIRPGDELFAVVG